MQWTRRHTFFADQAVVPVVGVVGISRNRTSSVAYDSEIKFYQRISFRIQANISQEWRYSLPRNSWPNLPMCPELFDIRDK